MYDDLLAKLAAITSMEGQIMAQVQIDDATLNSVVSALEGLSSAVETFIANNPQIPQADLTALQQALTDGQKAQTDLAALNPPPAPAP